MRRSQLSIFQFWVPLAATWVMMAVEGPFLAAVIARLSDPTFNLAAHGVAFAVAILIEAPVIMLMSASTALVEDASSYRRMWIFTWTLNVATTLLLVLLLAPPLFDLVMEGLIGLPPRVAGLTYGALWLFLPWPAAIGYRRFLHGLLIRSGRTRLVALGTVLRLVGMGGTALLLYFLADIPGAWVGAASLSAGVCVEALAARLMASGTVAELRARTATEVDAFRAVDEGATVTETAATAAEARKAPTGSGGELGYREILRFYYPLALTSLIGLTVHPLLTFFMGRAPAPVESLAVFPVVHALSFVFRAFGLSFQEAAIALLGRECEHAPELGRFALGLGLVSTGGLALVAFTPLSTFWFETVSGLSPELADFAILPTQIIVLLPALSVLLSFERAILVQGRRTRPITVATVIEVTGIALLFPLFGFGVGMVGVTAAAIAFVGGRVGGTAFLLRGMLKVLGRERTARARAD